jgi:TatD DNase family protein
MSFLLDTHYHTDFLPGKDLRQTFLEEAKKEGFIPVHMSLMPSTFAELYEDLSLQTPFLALGYHPWWIGSREEVSKELDIFRSELRKTRYIGEIGLDFSPKGLNKASKDLQEDVFSTILKAILAEVHKNPSQSPYILSVHAVRSAGRIMDIYEDLGLTKEKIILIFHWFSGTGNELTRLRKMGAYVSFNAFMLKTKKGRSYSQQIEGDKILLETDLPDEASLLKKEEDYRLRARALAREAACSLQSSLDTISKLRGEAMRLKIEENQSRLYFSEY